MYHDVMTDMTVAQVAVICGVTERTVRRWLKEGRLAGIRVGGRIHIDPKAVGELAAPYGDAAPEPAPLVSPLRAYLEDPERLAAVRARRAARVISLIAQVRDMSRDTQPPAGALDPEGIVRAVRDEQDAEWDEWLG